MLTQPQEQSVSDIKTLIHEAIASLRRGQMAAAEELLNKALGLLGRL